MQKILSLRFICVLLLLAMLLGVFAGCQSTPAGTPETEARTETGAEDPETGSPETQGEAKETDPETVPSGAETDAESESTSSDGIRLDSGFTIYRSADSLVATKAANYIKSAASKLFGLTLKVSSDKLAAGTTIDPSEKVILIGSTNRPASQTEMAGLRSADYMYSVPDQRTIVIGGFDSDSLLLAAQEFCMAAFGYSETTPGKANLIPVGLKKIFEVGNYPVHSLKLNGIDAANLRILYKGGSSEATTSAKKITKILAEWTGYVVPVAKADSDTTTPAIRLVCDAADIAYRIEKANGSVVITAPTSSMSEAVTKFVNLYLSGTPEETMDIKISDTPTVVYSFSEAEFNGIELQSRTDEQVRPGITHTVLTYKNRNGKPVIAHAIIVKKGAGEFFLGTPDGLPKQDSLQAPLEQALAVEARFQDVDVVAVVNGDQFYNYYPLGLTYMNGEKLYDPSGLTPHCFAMMMDGSYYCGTPSGIKDKTKIWSCVGANGMILEKGKVVRNGTADWFTVTHPRTALGYDDEGNLYILEVDGRQANVSNGASFVDMAVMFLTLGATNAVNVDGGGSSIMYVEDQNGQLQQLTSPSDGKIRRVINTVLVVVKKES